MGPLVYDIARGSFEDGPGIRTVVFLQGCPLRCAWCHNPESQTEAPGQNGRVRRYSHEELAEIISRDIPYYHASGGGVTFSGGEPLMQIKELIGLCALLKERGVSIAFDTSGYFDCTEFEEKLMGYTDMLLFDLKILHDADSASCIGKGSERIVSNLRRLITSDVKIRIRIPIIPDFTVTDRNLRDIGVLLHNLGIREFDMISYNPSFFDKLAKLGRPANNLLPRKPLTINEEMIFRKRLSEIIDSNDITCNPNQKHTEQKQCTKSYYTPQ